MKLGWKWYKFRVYFAQVSIALYVFLALIFAVQIMQTPSAVVLVLLNLAACVVYGLFFYTLREYKRYLELRRVFRLSWFIFIRGRTILRIERGGKSQVKTNLAAKATPLPNTQF